MKTIGIFWVLLAITISIHRSSLQRGASSIRIITLAFSILQLLLITIHWAITCDQLVDAFVYSNSANSPLPYGTIAYYADVQSAKHCVISVCYLLEGILADM